MRVKLGILPPSQLHIHEFRFQNGGLVETWWNFFFLGYFLFLEALNSSELGGHRIRNYFFLLPSLATDVYHFGAKSCSMKLISKFHQRKYGNLLGYIRTQSIWDGLIPFIERWHCFLNEFLKRQYMPIIKFSKGTEETSSPSLPVQWAPQSLSSPGTHHLLYPF